MWCTTYYTCDLQLRLPRSFPSQKCVHQEEMLINQSARIAWPQLFDSERSFRVDGIDADRSGQGMSSMVISKKIKEGIFHSFNKKNCVLPSIALKKPQVLVIGYNQRYKCTISVDTAGQACQAGLAQDHQHVKET